MEVTIKDIAKRIGVSYATVSRALNDRPGVRASLKDRIMNEARKMGYQPNAVARGLIMKKTDTIGLVIPDITNPFFPEVARGVEDAASDLGYNLFLCNTNWSAEKEKTYLRVLQEKRADGIIITPVSDDDESVFDQVSIPLVFVSRLPANSSNSYVTIDNVRGGFLATKHLIEGGYRRIAFVGGNAEVHVNAERLEGYRSALARYHYRLDDNLVVSGSFKTESGYALAQTLLALPDPPDAVFAANDVIALGVLQYVSEAGLRVPEDFGIIGFDDIPFVSYPQIRLTTVSQPKYEMGRTAAEICIARVDGGRDKEVRTILEPELVIRSTTRKL